MSFLKLSHINKNYGSKVVLNDLNLELTKGELLVILGPSGHGKTKLLDIIADLEKPSSGTREFQGSKIGIVFQDYALFPHLSVRDNILFGLKITKTPLDKEHFDYLINLMQLSDLLDRYPDQLSGGQQQRVALARALIIEPDLLLFDEPFSALDAQLRQSLALECKQILKDNNLTAIFVTHDQEEAYLLADRIAILYNGQIIQTDKPKKIFSNPKNKEVAYFLGLENIYASKCKIAWQDEKTEKHYWIKPYAIDISLERASSKDFCLSGIIKSIINTPNAIKFYVRLNDSGENIVVNSHPILVEDKNLAVNDAVYIFFNNEAIYPLF